MAKVTVEAKRGFRKSLPKLFTNPEDIQPSLGMDWLREIDWTIRDVEKRTTITDQLEMNKIITNFEKLFKRNRTIKNTENKIQLKTGHPPIKQKTRAIPKYLQSYVEKEINNII